MPDFDFSVLGTREHPTLGLDTFGDAPLDGAPANHAETLRQTVAEAVLADRVGVDYIGLGEHHRPDYAISAPDVVLAAIAGQTERIRLGTGVTVLSSDDPIRVYQRFATLDAVSNGRAEVQLGRGSFIESFGALRARAVRLRPALRREARPVRRAPGRGPSPGRAPSARRWSTSGSTRRPPPAACPPGSASAARRSRWCAPRSTACR